MASPEDKARHARHRKAKLKARERQRSVIAKELITSGKYKPRIVRDKRGREHDLNKLTNYELIQLINEDE